MTGVRWGLGKKVSGLMVGVSVLDLSSEVLGNYCLEVVEALVGAKVLKSLGR